MRMARARDHLADTGSSSSGGIGGMGREEPWVFNTCWTDPVLPGGGRCNRMRTGRLGVREQRIDLDGACCSGRCGLRGDR